MFGDISGIGGLQDSLATTNELLAQVLAELKQTNALLLDRVTAELQSLNDATRERSLS